MTGSTVIVGGGIAGLATAALLARAGWQVDLIEQSDGLGGRAGSWERQGFRFDTGPSWYLMPDVFEHFFRLMGTTTSEQVDLIPLDPGYRVFFEDCPEALDVAATLEANQAMFEAVEPGAGERLAQYAESARSTYEMAMHRFLYSSFETLWPLLRPDLVRLLPTLVPLLTRSLHSHVAARFRDHRLRQILGYPAVFLGTSPERAPSLYHLMSWLDLAVGVQYPRGGFTALVDAIAGLASDAGARLHTRTAATAILTRPTGRSTGAASGVRVLHGGGQEQTLAADIVVAAADLHHVETGLLEPELRSRSASWWRRRDPGPGAVLVMLGVEGGLPQLAHHSLFFVRDWDRNFRDIFERPTRVPDPASVYVCRPSATDDSVAPPGHENLFVLVPVPADVSIGHGGVDGAGDPAVEKAADAAVAQVARWAEVLDLAERVVVRRTVGPADFADDLNAWSGGALGPGHTLGQSAFLRAGNASRKVDGLLYVGSSTIPGVGLPMCLISAELVLKRLRRDRSNRPLATPLMP